MKYSIMTIAIILLLLTSPISVTSTNQTKTDWLSYQQYKLKTTIQTDINITKTAKTRLEMIEARTSLFPQQTASQSILSITTQPPVAEKNHELVFKWYNPKEKTLSYKINATVKTTPATSQIKTKIAFPPNIDREKFSLYLEPTELIDSNNPLIKEKAIELASDKNDLFDVVFTLANWVYQHVNYNELLGKEVKKASWVLTYKQGTCDEFTALFVALCRALDIPAKYISGIAYSNIISSFEMHAWASVYFPNYGWIPFDPTYGQFGYVDASHIVLKESYDAETKAVKLVWRGSDIEITASQPSANAYLLDTSGKRTSPIEITPSILFKRTGFGSYNLVKATITNENNFYVSEEISLAKPNEIELLDAQIKHILLKPNEEKQIFWRIKVKPDLERNAIYTFPIIIKSNLLSKQLEFKSAYKETIYSLSTINQHVPEQLLPKEGGATIQCIAEKQTLAVGESSLISCTLKNNNQFPIEQLQLCFDKDCKTVSIQSGEEKVFPFIFSSETAGETDLTITASSEFFSKKIILTFTILDEPKIEITDLSYPEKVEYNTKFTISFTIKKLSYRNPSNVKIILKQNKYKKEWYLRKLETDKQMRISLSGSDLDPGTNQISLTILYNGKQAGAQFTISLEKVTFFQRAILFLKKLTKALSSIFR
ncbi:hypothetical protein DRZ77_01190 [Candidatus Woesearchaeota archaeon]|nr:transglutaminase-like domain-containing protein [Candidatus Woesearchaeota archaeon]RLE40831.1 MAG: hypothetical protein DRZ77_01190 [Candidatus Woesearchaeota archaeon]